MNCPVCGGKTGVRCNRVDCESVARRRICKECGHEFFTTEIELPDSRDEFYRLNREYDHLRQFKRIAR